MKSCVIANTFSGNGRSRAKLEAFLAAMKTRGLRFDLHRCESLEHASALSRQAAVEDYEAIVALGGDGTINRVLNGLYDTNGRRRSGTAFGVVHTGSSPDFCRSHHIPVDVDPAVDCLANFKTRPVPIGRVSFTSDAAIAGEGKPEVRYFGCCANVGLGAVLARTVNRGIRKYTGDFAGTLLCLLAVLKKFRPIRTRLQLEGRPCMLSPVVNISVGLTRHIASGLKVIHALAPDDRRLYVLTLGPLRFWDLPGLLRSAYSGNTQRCHRFHLEYATEVNVSAAEASPGLEVEFDGDPAGRCPCRIELAADRLDLIVGNAS